jgi:hypothetical protein
LPFGMEENGQATHAVSAHFDSSTMMSGDIVTKTKIIRVGTRPVPAYRFYEWKKVLGGKTPTRSA